MKRIALVLLTATALLVAGCGSSSDQNDYVKQVNAVDAKATAVLSNAGNAPKTTAGTAKHFDTVADNLKPVIAEYKAFDPPSNAKSAHAETIAGMTGVVALFHSFAADFRSAKTPDEFNAIAARLADITSAKPFRQLDDARAKLAKAGYKVQDDTTTTAK